MSLPPCSIWMMVGRPLDQLPPEQRLPVPLISYLQSPSREVGCIPAGCARIAPRLLSSTGALSSALPDSDRPLFLVKSAINFLI